MKIQDLNLPDWFCEHIQAPALTLNMLMGWVWLVEEEYKMTAAQIRMLSRLHVGLMMKILGEPGTLTSYNTTGALFCDWVSQK